MLQAIRFEPSFLFLYLFILSDRYRVVLFGDAGTGKTALVSQFMTSEYMHTYDASLGKLNGKKIYFWTCSFEVLHQVSRSTIDNGHKILAKKENTDKLRWTSIAKFIRPFNQPYHLPYDVSNFLQLELTVSSNRSKYGPDQFTLIE